MRGQLAPSPLRGAALGASGENFNLKLLSPVELTLIKHYISHVSAQRKLSYLKTKLKFWEDSVKASHCKKKVWVITTINKIRRGAVIKS